MSSRRLVQVRSARPAGCLETKRAPNHGVALAPRLWPERRPATKYIVPCGDGDGLEKIDRTMRSAATGTGRMHGTRELNGAHRTTKRNPPLIHQRVDCVLLIW
jgi:hypothetical protein